MSFDISQYELPQLDDKTTEILLKIGGAVALYLPSLLGCYLGYSVSSNHALNYWIAAQNVPAPKAGYEAPKTKAQLLKLVLFTWLGGYLIYSVGYLGGPFAWWNILLLPFTWISTLAYLNATRKVPMSVHRNKNGEPILASGPSTPWSRFFVFVSLYATVYALREANANTGGCPGGMLSLMGFAGMIYLYASGGYPTKKMNLFGLLMTQYLGPLTFIPTAYFLLTDVKWREALGDFFDQIMASQAGNSLFRAMLLPIFFASIGQVLAMLLRFDYMTFASKHPEILEANPLALEAAPLTSLKPGTSKAVEDGVKLPNKLPFNFSKKYYRTAFATWFLTMTSLIFVSVFIFPGMNEFATIFVAYYASLVTSTTAPLFLALCSGEFRMLWKYSEDWKLTPVPAVVDPAQELVDEITKEKKEEELLVQV